MGLILVRHTRPDLPTDFCYGRLDVGLPNTFQEEAAVVHRNLPAVDRVVSSPLGRCRKLAQFIARKRGLPLDIDTRLVEMDFGAWEGRPWSQLPTAELEAWSQDFMHARPHGGESVAMLKDRAVDALADWSRRQECIAVVTHLGIIRVACAGAGVEAQHFAVSVDFGGIMALPDNEQSP